MSSEDSTFIAYQKAHYHDDKRPGIIISNSILLAVAYIAVLLKFIARRLARTEFKADDYWNWTSLVIFTAYVCGDLTLVHYGLGLHIIRITSLKGFVISLKSSTVNACIYNLNILSVKLSFLLFYRRLFPQRNFKIALLATGTLIVSSTTAFLFLDILQCVPPASQWDTSVKGKCVNFTAVVLAAGVINVVTDFTILILPMPVLWNLKVSKARKRMTMGTFMLGGLVCGVSTVRCFFLSSFKGHDVSWGNVDTVDLSTVEIGIGILSSCLPAYRPLYNHVFLGRATVNISKSRSKTLKPSDGSGHGGIRMAGLRGKDGHLNLSSQEDDEERLYIGRTVTTVRAEEDHTYGQNVRNGNGIGITRQIATSTAAAPSV